MVQSRPIGRIPRRPWLQQETTWSWLQVEVGGGGGGAGVGELGAGAGAAATRAAAKRVTRVVVNCILDGIFVVWRKSPWRVVEGD